MIQSKLSRKVLLLNSSYEPLNIVNAKKAIIMMLLDKVDYVEKTNISINSVNSKLLLPSIIKLKCYIYIKRRRLSLTRKNIFIRDNYVCQYCNKGNCQLTIDHVIPKYKGGTDHWENLVSACNSCNLIKGNKLLKDINMYLINKPKKPHYLLYIQGQVNNEYNSWKPYLYMN